jgi:uncharacterized protein YoaH (UPF0181 family)
MAVSAPSRTTSASSRDDLQRVAGEQASLRRVATLVAEGRSSGEILAAVAKEMALVFDADASVIHRLDRTGCRRSSRRMARNRT